MKSAFVLCVFSEASLSMTSGMPVSLQQRQQNKNNYWSETNAFVLINRFLFTWTVKSLQQDNINETRGWVWRTTEELYVIHCQELTLNAFLAPQRWLESFWELIKCQGTCHKIFDQVDLRRTLSTTNRAKEMQFWRSSLHLSLIWWYLLSWQYLNC